MEQLVTADAPPRSETSIEALLAEAIALKPLQIYKRITKRLGHGTMTGNRIYISDVQVLEELFDIAKEVDNSEEQRGKIVELLYDLGLLGTPPKDLKENRIYLLAHNRNRLDHIDLRDGGEEPHISEPMSDHGWIEVSTQGDEVEGSVCEPTISAQQLLREYQTLEDTASICASKKVQGSDDLSDGSEPLQRLLEKHFQPALARYGANAQTVAVALASLASDDMIKWRPGDDMIDLRSYLPSGFGSDYPSRLAEMTSNLGGTSPGGWEPV